MRAYVLNLDSAPKRWEFMTQRLNGTKLTVCRVKAVDGRALEFPREHYSEADYHWFHGRGTNLAEVGCYLSHLKAMRAFLETGDSHALICEDDIIPHPGFEETLDSAMAYSNKWNILRLSGLRNCRVARVAALSGGYTLGVNLGRLKGAGSYVVDRLAARTLSERLLPMWLPFDHAVDREWFYGLRAACVAPFPTSQNDSGLGSSIQNSAAGKLKHYRRWFTTYPYQMYNEGARWLFRTGSWLPWALAPKGGNLFSQPADLEC